MTEQEAWETFAAAALGGLVSDKEWAPESRRRAEVVALVAAQCADQMMEERRRRFPWEPEP